MSIECNYVKLFTKIGYNSPMISFTVPCMCWHSRVKENQSTPFHRFTSELLISLILLILYVTQNSLFLVKCSPRDTVSVFFDAYVARNEVKEKKGDFATS